MFVVKSQDGRFWAGSPRPVYDSRVARRFWSVGDALAGLETARRALPGGCWTIGKA